MHMHLSFIPGNCIKFVDEHCSWINIVNSSAADSGGDNNNRDLVATLLHRCNSHWGFAVHRCVLGPRDNRCEADRSQFGDHRGPGACMCVYICRYECVWTFSSSGVCIRDLLSPLAFAFLSCIFDGWTGP